MQLKMHKVFRGEKQREELCRDILSSIVEVTYADVGVFYFLEGDELHFIAGHASPSECYMKKVIKLGEGLSGLAASSNKVQLIDGIHDKSLVLESSTQTLQLKSIMAVPIAYENKVLAVIEIGAINSFLKGSLEFMEQIRESIAISLYMVLSREKLQDTIVQEKEQTALINSQASMLKSKNEELAQQTEELQTRQEEIEQNNEELVEQSAALEEKTMQLEQSNVSLEKSRERLEKKTHELELSNRYKSEFLANMSHELRTPLNSILVLSQLLAENKSKNLDKNQVDSVSTIYKCGNDLLALINDVLDLSKIEANRMTINFEKVHTNKLIDNLYDVFDVMITEKGLSLEVNIEKNFPKFFTSDPMRLEQILKNFLSNSLKFTEKGKIIIKCSVIDKVRKLAFSVIDTGIGIPSDKLNDIFGVFQQLDGSTARIYGGTGLGLAISTQLAKLIKGEVTVESTVNEGSQFTIVIPESPELKQAKIIPDTSDSSLNESMPNDCIRDDRDNLDSSKKTLLIIESNLSLAKAIIDFVRENQFQVLFADSEKEGLTVANDNLPDGIILDTQLPEIDGINVLKSLKENVNTYFIPVHMVNTQPGEQGMLLIGDRSYVQKPIDTDALQKIYNNICVATNTDAPHILLLENKNIEQTLIKNFFKDYHVKVKTVKTVKSAFNYLKENTVDGLLMNLALQGENRSDLYALIAADESILFPTTFIYSDKELTKKEISKLYLSAQTAVSNRPVSRQQLLKEIGVFLNKIKRSVNSYPDNIRDSSFELPIILLVDDDERTIFALKQVFQTLDALVISAKNGKDAVELFKEYPNTALIIMDIMMPVMDGLKATEKIRKINNSVPIIALTAKSMPEDKTDCLKAGCTDYISKPVNNHRLLALVKLRLGLLDE